MKKYLCILMVWLSGCSTGPVFDGSEASDDIQAGLELQAEADDAYLDQQDSQIFLGQVFELAPETDLPAVFTDEVALSSAAPRSLPEIATYITTATGIPVIIAADLSDVQPFSFPYRGPLGYLLDILASRVNGSWRYEDNHLTFYRNSTVVYYVETLPGSTEIEAVLSTSTEITGEGGSAKGSSGHTSRMSSGGSVYEGVSSAVEGMLSESGRLSSNPATGAITVTDTARVHQNVAQYIDRENERLTRQVVIDIRIINFTSNHQEAHGVDLEALYSATSKTLKGAFPIPTVERSGSLTFQIIDEGSRWGGSKAILAALDTQGTTSIVTSAPVITLHNQPANVLVVDEEHYIADLETSLVANAGATQSTKQSSVSTGLSLSVTPHILNDRGMILQMAINLTALEGFTETPIVGNGTSITLKSPNQLRRAFLQRVHVKSGQTLVMAGFENELQSLTHSGPINHKVWQAGGQRQASNNHSSLIILVTPRVLRDGGQR